MLPIPFAVEIDDYVMQRAVSMPNVHFESETGLSCLIMPSEITTNTKTNLMAIIIIMGQKCALILRMHASFSVDEDE